MGELELFIILGVVLLHLSIWALALAAIRRERQHTLNLIDTAFINMQTTQNENVEVVNKYFSDVAQYVKEVSEQSSVLQNKYIERDEALEDFAQAVKRYYQDTGEFFEHDPLIITHPRHAKMLTEMGFTYEHMTFLIT